MTRKELLELQRKISQQLDNKKVSEKESLIADLKKSGKWQKLKDKYNSIMKQAKSLCKKEKVTFSLI
jgi:hypothetical protein